MPRLKFSPLAAASLVTVIVATLLIIFGTPSSFLSIEGLIIVVGGSLLNAFMSFSKADVLKAVDAIRHMLDQPPPSPNKLHRDILRILMWSHTVQTKDFLGLEKEIAGKVSDPLLRYGLDMVVTGYSSGQIRDMMHTVTDAEFERRNVPVTILRNAAATAPAFGMVGTLIGMVVLLNNVGTEFSTLGSGLALAMLSTLYGILVARLVCLPAADKLTQKEEQEHFRYDMIAEGLALLAEKHKPYYIQDKLNSFLEPSRQLNFSAHMMFSNRHPATLAAA